MVNGTSNYARTMNASQTTYVSPPCDNALVDMIDECARQNGEKRNAFAKRALISAVNAFGLKKPDGTPRQYVTPADNALAIANAAAKEAQDALAKAQQELAELRAKLPATPTNGVNPAKV